MVNDMKTGNVLRYDGITSWNCGIIQHPQEQMKQLGYTLLECEPVPIGDCWIFKVDKIIKPLPKYLSIINEE